MSFVFDLPLAPTHPRTPRLWPLISFHHTSRPAAAAAAARHTIPKHSCAGIFLNLNPGTCDHVCGVTHSSQMTVGRSYARGYCGSWAREGCKFVSGRAWLLTRGDTPAAGPNKWGASHRHCSVRSVFAGTSPGEHAHARASLVPCA